MTGEAALDRLSAAPADVVLLDVMLPGLDGLEVCRRLRRSSEVPVIMLTARGGDLDIVGGLEAGADDYVVKPVEPRVLDARIRAVLRPWSRAPRPKTHGEPVIDRASLIVRQARPGGRADPDRAAAAAGSGPARRAGCSPATSSSAWWRRVVRAGSVGGSGQPWQAAPGQS